MESFILEPTSKIDFRCSTATAHLIGLQRKYHVSEQLWNSIPNSEFLHSQCSGASIYRLGAQMSVRQNIPRRRPDGGHGPSGRTTVRQDFPKISRGNLSSLKAHSDGMARRPCGRTFATSNFLIRLRASGPWGMSVRTAELQHAIFISDVHASEP
jgi:hypothetical protein